MHFTSKVGCIELVSTNLKEIYKNCKFKSSKMNLPSVVPLTSFSSGHGDDDVGGVVIDIRVIILVVVGICADAVQIVVVIIHVVIHVDHLKTIYRNDKLSTLNLGNLVKLRYSFGGSSTLLYYNQIYTEPVSPNPFWLSATFLRHP